MTYYDLKCLFYHTFDSLAIKASKKITPEEYQEAIDKYLEYCNMLSKEVWIQNRIDDLIWTCEHRCFNKEDK